ncbi:TPA: YjiK family protein [Escherichia coli]|uniref:SdiA-regulated domain-containing protein n=1 Tax=Escherichia coli TaxID=562 RepID=UPI0006A5CA14|nr:SdiA-regulated domain-containing protein [Escherichia coli]EFB5463840.1 esterase-like activity of phytase [Escherichia coli]EFB5489323.1 esterase-like activity of phytase [Escherichia coli]EGT2315084.1 YjiK family protein [Escherichia coli]EGT2319616.1 YjiK family protein [Escherichia coli]EJK5710098.1 YjiK family protein [Escherichia coli]
MKDSIKKHKKKLIVFMFIISAISCVNLSTPYEMSDDSYILNIKKEFLNINNLSSLTYSPHDGYLYATVNKPAKVLKISTDGAIHQIKDMPFIKDAESIEYLTENMFLAADEETSILYLLSIEKDMEVKIKKSIQLDVFKEKKNRGFEGLGWEESSYTLFAAKESKPAKLFSYKLNLNNASAKNEPKRKLDVNLKDISGLDVYKNNLRVLSDESRLLINIDLLTNKKNILLNLRQGHHDLQEDVPQAEGVVTAPNGDIYIVSEPNIFYHFKKQVDDKNNDNQQS